MLHCNKLTCVREDRILFQDLSFTLNAGEMLQVEGPNGAGKTTLFRLLAGLSTPYAGDVFWQGQSISSDRESFYKQLLFIGHKTGIKPELTALENLQFFQKVYAAHAHLNLWDILAKVGLAGYEDVTTSQLSAGQQRRVALARLWVNDCRLWLLDEPFTALDKSGVAVLESLFVEHAEKGGIVVLSTHQELSIDSCFFSKITLKKNAGERHV